MKYLRKGYVFLIALSLSSSLLTGCKSSKIKESSNVISSKDKIMEANKNDNSKNKEIHKKEDEKQLNSKKATNISTSKKHSRKNLKESYLDDRYIINNKDKKTVNNKLYEDRIIASKKFSEKDCDANNINKKGNKTKSLNTKSNEDNKVKEDDQIKNINTKFNDDDEAKEGTQIKNVDIESNDDNKIKEDTQIKNVDTESNDDNEVKEDAQIKNVDTESNDDNKVKEDTQNKDMGTKPSEGDEVKEDSQNKDVDIKPSEDNEAKEDTKNKDVDIKPSEDNEVKEDSQNKDVDIKPSEGDEVKEDTQNKDVDIKPSEDSEVKEDTQNKDVDIKPSEGNEVKEDTQNKDMDIKPSEGDEVKEDTQIDSLELVNIKDENLRKVINRALGRDLNSLDNITIHDMENINKIDSGFLALYTDEKGEPRRGIKSLSGLEHAKNLKTLKVSMNNISDLTPIKDLTNLEFLEVFRNEISDLTPLRNLKNLEHLDIYNNAGIVNLEPISKLNKINFIDMHYCNRRTAKVTYEHLGSLTNLEFLSIDDNFVDDISFVKNLKKLNTFSCNNNYVTNLNDIQSLAADSFEDWSGDKFFNMYGQMLKEDIKVQAPSDGIIYKMKCPVTGADKYIEKIYKTYEITEGLPALIIPSENKNIPLKYNKITNELELTVGKNDSSEKTNTKFNAVLEYGMYSLKMTFDITQDGINDISKIKINEI